MTTFAGIQLGSPMVANFALPLDRKTYRATTAERNALSVTQRWIGMTGYCVADGKYYQLKTDSLGTETVDGDRIEFGKSGFNIYTGSGIPTIAPENIGDEYLDTDTGSWYKANGLTSLDRNLL